MASTQKKKTAAKSSSKKSTAAKGGTRKAPVKEQPAPQKRPIRREVGGVVCLLLAVFGIISYFKVSAIFIDWFRNLMGGLFGYGFWLVPPVLLLSAQKDQVVRNDYQEKFVKKLPNGKMVTLEEATHAMLAGTEKTIAEHVGLTLDFFG